MVENRHYVRSAGGWRGVLYDTGWHDIPLAVGTGTLKWRAIGDDVEVYWNGSGSYPTGAQTISSTPIPADYRPTQNVRGTGVLNANPAGSLYVTAAGNIGLINATGGTRTGGEGTVRYMLD